MVVLTVVSVIVATISAVAARSANAEADRANGLAQKANDEAAKANRLAMQSNAKAEESNAIASRAQEFAEAVPVEQAWDEAITAVQAMQNFNPNGNEEAGPYLRNMRTRMLLLVDKVHWEGFDKWVAAELRQASTLLREGLHLGTKLRQAQHGELTVDQQLQFLQPFASWVAAFTLNLRKLRRDGWQSQQEIEALTAHANKMVVEKHEQHGWEEPPMQVPGIQNLEL